MVAPFFYVFSNELMGISIWRMSVFLIIRNMDNTILSTGTRPNHTFAVLAFAFLLLFCIPRLHFGGRRGSKRVLAVCRVSSLQLRHQSFETRFCRQAHVQTLIFLVFPGRFLEIFRSFSTKKDQHGYFLVAGVGPNECWLFVEYHHYNFVTTSSPILRNTILSTGTRPNRHFLVCFLLVFLRFSHHFLIKKLHMAQEPTKMAQDGS